MIPFNTPWKDQETWGFLMFSGGIKRDKWDEMGYVFSFSSPITSPNENTSKQPELLWRRGVLVITTEKTSLYKAYTQILPRLKSSSGRVGSVRWWEPITMVPAGNKTQHISVGHALRKNNL